MSWSWFRRVCGLTGFCFITGCSSLMNVSGNYFAYGPTDDFKKPPPKRVYGGVMLAGHMGWNYVNYRTQDGAELFALPFGLAIWAVDVPSSFVGDTLTLPWTIPAEIERGVNDYYFRDADHGDWSR